MKRTVVAATWLFSLLTALVALPQMGHAQSATSWTATPFTNDGASDGGSESCNPGGFARDTSGFLAGGTFTFSVDDTMNALTPAGDTLTALTITIQADSAFSGSSNVVDITADLNQGTATVAQPDGDQNIPGTCQTFTFTLDVTGWNPGAVNTIDINADGFLAIEQSATVVGTYETAVTYTASPTNLNVPPLGTATFSASGGSGSYTWTAANGTFGASNTTTSTTGAVTYTAPANTDPTVPSTTTDTLTLDDGFQSQQITINIGPGVTGTASNIGPEVGTAITLTPSGGDDITFNTSPTWTYMLDSASVGAGTITPSTDTQTATFTGTTAGAVIIDVTDDLGNTGSINVTVGGGPGWATSYFEVAPNQQLTGLYNAVGGGTAPYTFSVDTNQDPSGAMQPVGDTYTAGPMGGAFPTFYDNLIVTDADGQSASIRVYVTGALAVASETTGTTMASTNPGGSVVFDVTGGDAPYTASIATGDDPSSNGTLSAKILDSGVNKQGIQTFTYTAGGNGSTTANPIVDTITITDSTNTSVTATIAIGPVLTISMPTMDVTVAPGGKVTFTAAGGDTTEGYNWSTTSNPSGGQFNTAAATTASVTYTAGSIGGVDAMNNPIVDHILVQDQDGGSATLNVTVSAAIAISPTGAAVSPNGTQSFTATGGAPDTTNLGPTGYTWSIVSDTTKGGSGGTIDQSGNYKAGAVIGTDTVTVTDANQQSVSATVSVGGIAISPTGLKVYPGQTYYSDKGKTVGFTATGGSGMGFTWSFTTDTAGSGSDRSINPLTGVYTAGTKGDYSKSNTVVDTIEVTDSSGGTTTTTVTVTAPVSISPTTASTTPGGQVSLKASGGSSSYTFSFGTPSSSNALTSTSGATLTVVGSTATYTASKTGTTGDTVTATDTFTSATSTITLGAGVSITAKSSYTPATTVPPNALPVALTAAGGSGTYTWKITTQGSKGSTLNTTSATTQNYYSGTAGSTTKNATDVVTLTDSNGSAATITITVTPDISISPASPSTSPSGTIKFTAAGGGGTGYKWSLTTGEAGSTIVTNADGSGTYTAGSGSAQDVVKVVDALTNTASVNVAVGAVLAITAANATTPPKGTDTFTAKGGAGGYTWSISSNNSGGSITTNSDGTGAYVAGSKGGVTDTIKVTDSTKVASATFAMPVSAGLSLTPPSASVQAGQTVQFSVTGGSGTGIAYSVSTNASGGTITSAGLYTAGATGGSDVVTVTDSLTNTDTATVTVIGKTSTNADMSTHGDMSSNNGDASMTEGDMSMTTESDAGTTTKKSSGCGCDVGGQTNSTGGILASVFMMAAALYIRRRRRA